MSEPLVVAEELEREYRMGPETVRVLRGVSLTVNAGESVAIIGASGVGQVHAAPPAGHARPADRRAACSSTARTCPLARTRPWRGCAAPRSGFIFQFYNLLGEMTALENAMMPALLQRASVPEARERAAAALHEVGLGDRQAHRPGRAVGRGAAARRHRPRARRPAAAGPGRRAHRQPGSEDERGDLGSLPPAPGGAGPGLRHRDPQPRAGPEGGPGIPAGGRSGGTVALSATSFKGLQGT